LKSVPFYATMKHGGRKMKHHWVVLLVFLVTLFLPGCFPLAATCPPDSLVNAPALNAPGMWEVVDALTPTLSWSFSAVSTSPNGDTNCVPDGYHVDLSTGPDFMDTLGGDVAGTSTSFTPGAPLEPGKQYAWGVYATVGGSESPYGGTRYFFTGPMCASEALVAPTLLWPPDGGVITAAEAEDTVDGPMPMLKWEYPDPCLPEGYRIDLSTDSSFVDTSLSGGTGHPSTRWMAGQPMEDCTTYYWRVAPINGTTLGPFSGTWSFDMAVGESCSPGLVTPTTVPWTTPLWILDVDSFCRQGPGSFYPAVATLKAGESYPMDGRNADNSWFVIRLIDARLCWLSAITGHMEGGKADDLNIRQSPPTSTPTVTPPPTATFTPLLDCSKYKDEKTCEAYPVCEWIRYATGGGYCQNK
jgi:hypothetical protein